MDRPLRKSRKILREIEANKGKLRGYGWICGVDNNIYIYDDAELIINPGRISSIMR